MAISKWGAGTIDRLRPAMYMGAFVVVILLAQVMTAPTASAANLGIDPASGPPGSTVAVSGNGFLPLAEVRFCWDGDRCANLGETRASVTGQMSVDITIPGDASGGTHSIHACERLAVDWSCDSIGFDVIVPTTTTTSTTTTTTVATTTTTSPPTTTTTSPPPPAASPPAPATPPPPATPPQATSPPVGGGATPTTGTDPTQGTAPPSTTSSSTGGTTTTTDGPDGTTTTTTTADDDDDTFGIIPTYRPPNSEAALPETESPDGVEATVLAGSDEEAAIGGGDEWMIAVVGVAVVAATLWVANNLVKGDRRRYILDLARHR